MNRKIIKTLILTLMIINLGLVALSSATYVTPELWDDWESGNAEDECSQISSGASFAYKIDDWDEDDGMDGTYTHAGNTITISNSDGKSFDWESDKPVVAVIVKASTKAYVYRYAGAYSDTGLEAPDGKDISHVTFCWIPEFVIPEAPIGTISTLLVMLGATVLLRYKPITIK